MVNFIETMVEEYREGEWPQLIERVWFYGQHGQMAETEIRQLRDHPDQLIQRTLRILTGNYPKRRILCSECGGVTLCQLIDAADGSSDDVADRTMLRLCQTCGLTYPMVDVDRSVCDEHRMFRESLEAITEALNRIERQEMLSATAVAEIRVALSPFADWTNRRERARANSVLVENLDLSVRARNILANADIESIDELCKRSADELLALRNMQPLQLEELRNELAKRGRQLRGD